MISQAKPIARSPADVCIEYALAVAAVREQTIFLRDRKNYCENYEPSEKAEYSVENMFETYPGYEGVSKDSCLDELFHAPKGPDGEFPRFREFFDKMCANCKKRHEAIQLRRKARQRLGNAKRCVENAGKREMKAVQP